MKIIVPTAGPAPDKRAVGYVVKIAKRLNAQLLVLRVVTGNETEEAAERILKLFIERGKEEKVAVDEVIKRGDIIHSVINNCAYYCAEFPIHGHLVKRTCIYIGRCV